MTSSGPTIVITDDFVRSFERRARFLRTTAAVIMFLIFALLGLGGFVFLYAPSIAAMDIEAGIDHGQQLQSSRDALAAEVENLTQLRDAYRQQFEVGQRTLIDVLKAENELMATRQNLDITEERLRRYRENGDTPSKSAIGNEKELEIAIRNKEELVEVLAIIKEFMDEQHDAGAGSSTDLLIVERNLSTEQNNLAELKSRQDSFAAREAGERNPSATGFLAGDALPTPASTAQLVQTNITRFGTLLVIFFFISVLVPIFRYNTQLGAYYDARADALLLLQTSEGQDIEALVSILTPSLAFEKAPSVPDQQSLEVAKEMIKTAAERGRD